MERAGRILAKWRASADRVDPALLARAVWRVAVGEKIAAHTAGAGLVRRRLVVEVEDEIWRRQLGSLRPLILRNLARELGEGVVEELEFRLASPRIGPGRAEAFGQDAVRRPPARDEADGIADPILRRLYRTSKGRRTA